MMTLSIDEKQILSLFKTRTDIDWEREIIRRGVDHKRDLRIQEAIDCYKHKIPLVIDALREAEGIASIQRINPEFMAETYRDAQEQVNNLSLKLQRLREKYAACLKELEWRKARLVSRTYHDTVYYIDLNAGNDSNTGLSPEQAWRTIDKYTTITVRSAGDIAWVRANTSQTLTANVVFDEDGTVNSRIEIRGCSSASGEDPWGDGSDVKPIFDANAANYYFFLSYNDYWQLYRMDIKGGTSYQVCVNNSIGILIEDCHIHAGGDSSTYGLYTLGSVVEMDGCAFDNLGNMCIYSDSGSILLCRDCTFDGGGTYSTNYGIYAYYSAVYADNCSFGVNNTLDNYEVYALNGGTVYLRGCVYTSNTFSVDASGKIYSEDHDGVKGAQWAKVYQGTVERDSTIQIDGLDSAKMTPTSYCGLYRPLTLSDRPLEGDYQVKCPAATTTITIKARETTAWTTDPTASEFYFEASYLDQAYPSAHRATQVSSQSLNGTTEVPFTMTFTPAQAGWVYVKCKLCKYESGKSVNVSVQATVS